MAIPLARRLTPQAARKASALWVTVKFEMIARRIAQAAVILRIQAMQQSKRSNLTATWLMVDLIRGS